MSLCSFFEGITEFVEKKKMEKIDQYLELLDDITPVYGKILDFSFFCQDVHNFSECKNENCNVGNFVNELINAEDVCFLSLELYIDKKFYVDFMEHFK